MLKKKRKKLLCNTNLKVGDTVMVISGGSSGKRDIKGQTGSITGFTGKKKDRVVVDGLNIMTKHKKQTTSANKSEIVKVEGSMHISNVMYYSDKAKKPVRISVSKDKDGKNVRGYKDPKTNEFVEIKG